MKTVIVLALAFMSLTASAQTSSGINWSLCITPVATASADSITLRANLNASGGYSSVTWAYVSGPTSYSFGTPILTSTSGTAVQSSLTIRKLSPGNYVFSATGISKDSLKGTVLMPVFVPTPPPPVVQRTAVSVQWLVFGQWINVPAGYFKIGYSDGSTQ